MARILLCGIPLDSPMYHALTFARRLRSRGHEVSVLGMPDCARYLTGTDFKLETIYEDWFPPGTFGGWLASGAFPFLEQVQRTQKAVRQVRRHLQYLIEGGHQRFTEKVRALDPQLILVIAEHHPNWALLAHHTGVPTVYLSCMLPMLEQPGIPPISSSFDPSTHRLGPLFSRMLWQRLLLEQGIEDTVLGLLTGMPRWRTLLDRLNTVLGNPPDFLQSRALMPLLNLPTLVMCPQAFDFPTPEPSPYIRYIEPCIDLERVPAPFDFSRLTPDRPLAYCSLGSILSLAPFCREVVEAFRRLPQWQLVLVVGSQVDPAQFEPLPPNVMAVKYAPQLELLQRAQLFISHAGMGSMMEALYFGVPMLLFPFHGDQQGVAARAVRHGVAHLGHFHQARAETIKRGVEAAHADETLRVNVRRLQQIFRQYEETQPGQVWLDRLLGTPP